MAGWSWAAAENSRMTQNPRLGITLAFVCLLILGVMPILASVRPAGASSLIFTVWMTLWQLVAAVPLFLRERAAGHRGLLGKIAPDRRRRTVAVAISPERCSGSRR